jgi:hypothetical protein
MARTLTNVVISLGLMLGLGAPALADWVPNQDDPRMATNHKMHWPQMPDPNGWDVSFYSSLMLQDPFGGSYLASAWPSGDDWRCSGTGPVTGIHFWVSMQGDTLQSNPDGDVPFQITFLSVRIRENVPAGGEYDYSTPGNPLWSADFSQAGGHVVSLWETHEQGWFVPVSGEAVPGDHDYIYQVNIPDTSVFGKEPFVQTEGEIYWLQIDLEAEGVDENGRPVPVNLGWKTALAEYKFLDDATYYYQTSNPNGPNIQEHRRLIIEGQPRDLAFVIVPEPATLALVALGAWGVLLRRRRR